MSDDMSGLRERLAKQGEETLGKLAQELLENPLVAGALSRAFEARERAVHAQEAAMGALNIPSAADIERLTRRLRSVAQRLEGIEDALDKVDRRLEGVGAASGVEQRLADLTAEVRRLAQAVEGGARAKPARAAAKRPATAKRASEATKPSPDTALPEPAP